MRKILISIIIFLLVLSCSKEPESVIDSTCHNISILAQIEDLSEVEETKASGQSIIRLKWTAGDKVSVVNVTTGKALGGYLQADAAGNSSIFSGNLVGSINVGDKLAFIYPSQDYTEETDFTSVVLDRSVQTSSSPSLMLIGHHTVESGSNSFTNQAITFNYQMHFLRINLCELPVSTSISSVIISGLNDLVTLSISGDKVVATPSSDKGYITYSGTASTNSYGTSSIFIGVPVSTSATSRTITVTTATNAYSANFTKSELKSGGYNYINIAGFVKSYMTFKDASVKAKCVELYDKNNDGNISFLEAAAVTDLGVATKAAGDNPFPTSILHFAELQFFTGLASIPSFQNYTMLKTVAIPSQISSIPANAFNGCSDLETVIFTSTTPPTIGTDAFTGCGSYISFYVPTESVDDYKTAMPSFSEKIHDIAEVGSDFGLEGWSEVQHNGSV